MINKSVIIKGVGGLYVVRKQGKLYNCRARGIFRKDAKSPIIGDYVELEEIDNVKQEAIISEIHERKNILIRPHVANIDQIVVVIAPVSPKPDILLIDKLIMTSINKGIKPVLVINKTDQDKNAVIPLYEEYKYALENILPTCAVASEGIEELRQVLTNKISVICGQSGVGKSTLLNELLDFEAMPTGDMSERSKRGKHTTRHSEMFSLKECDGYLIDSPGFSLFDLEEIESSDLQNLYPELYNMKSCRFQDCSHTGEPGCNVKELIEKGTFPKGRYDRYVSIYKELKQQEQDKYR